MTRKQRATFILNISVSIFQQVTTSSVLQMRNYWGDQTSQRCFITLCVGKTKRWGAAGEDSRLSTTHHCLWHSVMVWVFTARKTALFGISAAGFGLLCHKETILPHFFSLIAAPDKMQPRNRFQIIIFINAFIKEPLFVRYLQFSYARKVCLLLNPDFHNQSDFISLQTMNTKEIIEFYFLLSCLSPVFL